MAEQAPYAVSNAQNTAEEAAAMNAAWRAGVPYVPSISPQQDAYNEEMKRQAAFSQPRNDLQAPRSQAFLDIQAQYDAQQNRVVTGGSRYQGAVYSNVNPYDPNTAAGIAWEVSRGGRGTGAVDTRLGQTAIAQGARPSEVFFSGVGEGGRRVNVSGESLMAGSAPIYSLASGQSTVQQDRAVESRIQQAQRLADIGMGAINFSFAAPQKNITGGYTDIDVAVGEGQGVRVRNAKLLADYNTGEFGIYQKVYDPNTGKERNITNLVGGGGRAALQSGMFAWGGETLSPRNLTFEQWEMGKIKPLPESYFETHSRRGAEAYGGYSGVALDARTIESTGAQMGRFASPFNLANLVNPQGANMSKGEAPGMNIPWGIGTGEAAITVRDYEGKGSTLRINPDMPGSRLVGGGKVAGEGVTTESQYPTPFRSTSVRPETDFLSGVSNWFTGGKNFEQSAAEVAKGQAAGYGGGLLGLSLFGEKAPEVIKGFAGSSVDFATSIVGWTPFKDRMQTVDPTLERFRQENVAMKAKPAEEYNQFLREQYNKGVLIIEPGKGQFVENPNLTYDYGEFSKWGAGAGKQVRGALGFSEAQLQMAQFNIEQKKGIETIPEKLVFGTGATFSTRPERIASAYGGGAIMLLGGEVGAGLYQGSGLAARAGAWAIAHPTAGAAISGAVKYGVPAGLIGLTYYGASEGLTASQERTTVNIGRMIPEGVGLIAGMGTARLGIMGIERGFIGFQSRLTEEGPIKPTRLEVLQGLEIQPRGSMDLPAPAPSGIRPVQIDPFVMAGKSRAGLMDLPAREFVASAEPGMISFDPFLSASAKGRGMPTFREQVTSAEFLRGGGIEPNIAGQPRSARSPIPKAFEILEPVSTGQMPMDLLPGTGKMGTFRQAAPSAFPEFKITAQQAEAFGIRLETPKGLETRISGAPISEGMLQQLINPEIQSGTRGGSAMRSLEATIRETQMQARVKPATRMAEQQSILPSATSKTFEPSFRFESGTVENLLKGIQESEKRTPTSGRMPKGMQIDYLRDALKQRGEVIQARAKFDMTKVREGQIQLSPTRQTLIRYQEQLRSPTVRGIPKDKLYLGSELVMDAKSINEMIRVPDQGTIPTQTTIPTTRQTSRGIERGLSQPELRTPADDKSYLQALERIRIPVTERITTRTTTPETPYVPTYEPPRTPVPEKPFIPPYEPTKTRVPEKPWVPPYEPEKGRIPTIPIIPIPPGIPFFPTLGGSPYSDIGRKRGGFKFTEYLSFIPRGRNRVRLPRKPAAAKKPVKRKK